MIPPPKKKGVYDIDSRKRWRTLFQQKNKQNNIFQEFKFNFTTFSLSFNDKLFSEKRERGTVQHPPLTSPARWL